MFKHSKNMFFYVKSGGCNGLEYVLEPCTSAPQNSESHKEDHWEPGVNLHVCNMSTLYVLGTTIEWKEDIMGCRFVFNNPNAHNMCGCGSTFSVKQ